jgi:outer membrane protein TolC
MGRHRRWIVATVAGAAVGMCLLRGWSEPPRPGLVSLDRVEADDETGPKSAQSGRASPQGVVANRPIGLGFPLQGGGGTISPAQAEKVVPTDKKIVQLELEVVEDDAPSLIPLPDGHSIHPLPASARNRSTADLIAASASAPPFVPANLDLDALPHIDGFAARASRLPQIETDLAINVGPQTLPPEFIPWWEERTADPVRNSSQQIPVTVESLVLGAIEFAPQVQSMKADPQIRSAYLCQELAAFDWRAFVDNRWDDFNDPVGNTLTTGNNSSRYVNQTWTGAAGLRRGNQYGGQFEVAEKLSWQQNNSRFSVPNPQGLARLQVSYTQPLLNGAGEAYNTSRIVLAQLDTHRSFDEVALELQEHLLKVAETYWSLYRSRAVFYQREKVLVSGVSILETLGGRQDVDAVERQVLRAKAAVASRQSEIVRAKAAIRNAESRLRLLVNSPDIQDLSELELLPAELPRIDYVPLSMTGSVQSALQHRPDISAAIRDMRATGVRLGVAKNELLPRLDVVMNAYTAGLAGVDYVPQSVGDQFSSGRPGYSVGLNFEVPLGNRAARARVNQREWEIAKSVQDFRTVVETGMTEVEIAVRDAETSHREMLGKFQSLIAAEQEEHYLDDRWRFLPGGDRGTTLLLEDLLDAQERLATAETEFVDAQIAYSLSLLRVRKAMGTLLICEAMPQLPPGSIEATPPVPSQIGAPHPVLEKPPEPTPAGPKDGKPGPLVLPDPTPPGE